MTEQGRAKGWGLVAMAELVVPDRAEGRDASPAVISKRSEKSCVSEDAFLGADDDCMRSLPAVRNDRGGRSR